jgi:hypothetical protein
MSQYDFNIILIPKKGLAFSIKICIGLPQFNCAILKICNPQLNLGARNPLPPFQSSISTNRVHYSFV